MFLAVRRKSCLMKIGELFDIRQTFPRRSRIYLRYYSIFVRQCRLISYMGKTKKLFCFLWEILEYIQKRLLNVSIFIKFVNKKDIYKNKIIICDFTFVLKSGFEFLGNVGINSKQLLTDLKTKNKG